MSDRNTSAVRYAAIAGALIVGVGWAYGEVLVYLARRWTVSADYSHGFLVPLFALAILWLRRGMLAGATLRPHWGAGVFLAVGAALYVAGTFFFMAWLVQLSLLPVLAACFMAVGGRAGLRWSWPAVAFLLFMIPLPGRAEGLLANPLQRIATVMSANALQTLGLLAQADGNVIVMEHVELGVVEACSGLRMLTTFFAASTAVAIVQQRPWPLRLAIVLSAVPIAILCNTVRITATGVLYERVSARLAELMFHDLAGWLMIPLALALLALGQWFLARLFVGGEAARPGPQQAGGPRPRRVLRPSVAEPSEPSPAV